MGPILAPTMMYFTNILLPFNVRRWGRRFQVSNTTTGISKSQKSEQFWTYCRKVVNDVAVWRVWHCGHLCPLCSRVSLCYAARIRASMWFIFRDHVYVIVAGIPALIKVLIFSSIDCFINNKIQFTPWTSVISKPYIKGCWETWRNWGYNLFHCCNTLCILMSIPWKKTTIMNICQRNDQYRAPVFSVWYLHKHPVPNTLMTITRMSIQSIVQYSFHTFSIRETLSYLLKKIYRSLP